MSVPSVFLDEDDWTLNERFINAAREGDLDGLKQLLKGKYASRRRDEDDYENNGCKLREDIVDINGKDDMSGATALHMASANGHTHVVEFLLAHCEPRAIYMTNQTGNTPLHWALQNGHWETAKVILTIARNDIDVLLKNEFGHSVLGEALRDHRLNGSPSASDPSSEDIIKEELVQLILEHPSAALLED